MTAPDTQPLHMTFCGVHRYWVEWECPACGLWQEHTHARHLATDPLCSCGYEISERALLTEAEWAYLCWWRTGQDWPMPDGWRP